MATIWEQMAGVLSYPREGYAERVAECGAALALEMPGAGDRMAAFHEAIRPLSGTELEELYTRTFDLNPECCLDVGWHLFGEDYERGRFMARLRGELEKHGVRENGELPDHLSHVLVLLGRMEAGPARRLVEACVAPALEAMGGKLKDRGNPYGDVIEAVRAVVARAVGRQEEVTVHGS